MPVGIYPRKSLLERFEAKVVKGENINDCWEWTSIKHTNGYGKILLNNFYQSAHRVSYELYKGSIPKNYQVNHKCKNNKLCTNPLHLYLGTQKENVNDRNNDGNNSRRTKLNIEKINDLHNQGWSNTKIGIKYGVSSQYISRIISGRQWCRNRDGENSIKQQLYEKQKGICSGCKSWTEWQFITTDHIMPKSKNGSNDIKNIQLLCRECNTLKSNNDMDYLFWRLEEKDKIKEYNKYLLDKEVLEIRQLYQQGDWKQKDLAIKYNTTRTTINRIVNNKTRRL